MKIIPSFFVVGAQKAGTTSLHDWLIQQPDVGLPQIKETHFFAYDDRYANGYDWYASQFNRPPGLNTVYGEIDPEYMFFKVTASRIREHICRPRFIFLLRNPLERAYSQYLMSVERGHEHLSFVEAISQERRRLSGEDNLHAMKHHSYLSRSLYAPQIRHFKSTFPESEFLFVKFEDMIDQSPENRVYHQICQFIGIQSDPCLADRSIQSNSAGVPRSAFIRNLINKQSFLRHLLGRFIPTQNLKIKAWILLNKLNRRPIRDKASVQSFSFTSATIHAIQDDLSSVQRLTNLDLSVWLQYNASLSLSRPQET